MARIAVVEQRPPRKVRVVRRGGNRALRSKPFEYTLGVLGLILLIAVLLLTPALPKDDPVPEQVQLRFTQTVTDIPLDITYEAAAGAKEYSLGLTVPPNTYVVEMVVEMEDDVVASLPDSGTAGIIDGVSPLGPAQALTTPQPVASDTPGGGYVGGVASLKLVYSFADLPSDSIESLPLNVPREDAISDLLGRFRVDAPEDLGARLVVTQVGDCPDPTGLDLQRAAACQAESSNPGGGSVDTLAQIRVVSVRFISLEAQVEPVQAP